MPQPVYDRRSRADQEAIKGIVISLRIIPRAEHKISRANISENALKVLYRLQGAGYQAHLVGGSVRDLLLGREPKDFDVATDASPEQVKAVFRNCRLIGRRFRLAHVHFGREIIEVATFRGVGNRGEELTGGHSADGMLLRDNSYGTIEEDAWRRDFSVNALYYNVADFSVADYTGGLPDLQAGVLRLLGQAEARFREDPVRMLRAVRFAAKLGFVIEPSTEAPIRALKSLLTGVPAARLFDEVLKLLLSGTAVSAFEKLRYYGLFAELFPATEASLAREQQAFPLTLVLKGLENTDARIAEDKPVTPAFLFAVLLWEPVRLAAETLQKRGMAPHPALQQAAGAVVEAQLRRVSLPRRFGTPMREIWTLQPRFAHTRGKRPQRTLAHPRFRAAFDFLLLRIAAGEADPALGDWWTRYQESDEAPEDEPRKATRSRRRRRRPSRRSGGVRPVS